MQPSEPSFVRVSEAVDRVRLEAQVPVNLGDLDGHFPGHPVVPGFRQVMWTLAEANRAFSRDAAVTGFEALRFPTSLLPGAAMALELSHGDGVVRFSLSGDDGVFASGRVRLASGLEPHAAAPAPEVLSSRAELRLPHQGTMRWLDGVVSHTPTATTATAMLRSDTPWVGADGSCDPSVVIELLAQAMAAHGGCAAEAGTPPRRGFLVSARQIELRTPALRVGEPLWVRADHVRGELGMVAFRCTLGNGAAPQDEPDARDRALALGTLGAFVEAAPESANSPSEGAPSRE